MGELPGAIGAYRLLETLGQGGMGVVYRARHEATGQVVALKTVRVPAEGLLQSIRREIHALARLRHPNIVPIVAEGLHEGVPWYAMELIEGQSLRQFVARLAHEAQTLPGAGRPEAGSAPRSGDTGPRATAATGQAGTAATGAGGPAVAARGEAPQAQTPPLRTEALAPQVVQAVLDVARRLCSPLAYLHGEGIVHRDLKPANVLVRPGGQPVLMDFGLATRFAAQLSRESLELGGRGAGTIAYMSPEQILGELGDARADLYALGCILYELLTGRPPFTGKASEVVQQHLTVEPQAPSHRVGGLPAELDELVLRLLRKEAHERLGYAGDVALALERLGAEAATEVVGRTYLYRPRLAGREPALARLERHLERARPTGGVLLVGGESGVGKTRLALELAQRAQRRRMPVLAGECVAPGLRPAGEGLAGGAALQPLLRPLQAVADRCRERGLDETERLLGRRGPLLARYEPALRRLPGQEAYGEPAELPVDAARLRLSTYLAETFGALAQDAPLLLLLDDLQWADELTFDFLEAHLQASRSAGQPGAGGSGSVVVLGTYRSDEVGLALSRLLASATGRLELARLDEAAVGAVAGDMLALTPPPALLARFLTRHSEGNPFFVAEYLRTAVDEGLLYRDGRGHWHVEEPGDDPATEAEYERLPLPRTVRELVGQRLASLPPQAQFLVEAAAVLGRESELELLEQVCAGSLARAGQARTGSPPISASTDELLRRQVLELSEPGQLRFVHDKLREVAYDRLGPEQRIRLHRVAAETLEARPEEDGGRLGALGQHWEQAQESERARGCYLKGARAALARYAQSEAERLYRAYLRLTGESATPESIAARNELGSKVLRGSGPIDASLREHEAALAEARRIGARRLECESLQLLGAAHNLAGKVERAQVLLEAAMDLVRELGDRALEAQVLGSLGSLYWDLSRLDDSRVVLRRALAIHRERGDLRSQTAMLRRLGGTAADEGRLEEARQLNEEALRLARAAGDRPAEALVSANLSHLYWLEGHPDAALRLLAESMDLFRQVGDLRSEAASRGNLASLHWLQGRPAVAQPLFEQSLEALRRLGDLRTEARMLGNLANLEWEEGRLPRAQPLYERALELHRQVGNRRSEGLVLSNLGGLHWELGNAELAWRLCDEALAIHQETGEPRFAGIALTRKSAFERLGKGDLQAAESLARRAEQSLKGVDESELGVAVCALARVKLAGAQGARAELERAQELMRTVGAGPRSPLGNAVAGLQRTVEAFEAGQQERLFRGELLEELPEGLRAWVGRLREALQGGS